MVYFKVLHPSIYLEELRQENNRPKLGQSLNQDSIDTDTTCQ
jgi:hypothetical protein